MVDSYQLANDIGKGNFGTVYRTQRPDGQVVAMKKMPKTKVPSDSPPCCELAFHPHPH